MGKQVWCENCGQRWMSLTAKHKPDCFFCGTEGSVTPVVPDKLVEKVKTLKAEVEAKADAKQRETHERTGYEKMSEADQDEQLAARD